MANIWIECPACNWEGNVDETFVGRRIKCPKCENSFVAEVGGAYDLEHTAPSESEGFDFPIASETPGSPDASPRRSREGEPTKAPMDEEHRASKFEDWASE